MCTYIGKYYKCDRFFFIFFSFTSIHPFHYFYGAPFPLSYSRPDFRIIHSLPSSIRFSICSLIFYSFPLNSQGFFFCFFLFFVFTPLSLPRFVGYSASFFYLYVLKHIPTTIMDKNWPSLLPENISKVYNKTKASNIKMEFVSPENI